MAVSASYTVRETATNLARNLLMTLASVLVVALSLTLVGGALLLRQGVSRQTLRWRGGVELSIFMKTTASPQQSDAVEHELASMKGRYVKRYLYVDQEAAKKEFDQLFADQPEMKNSVQAKDLPPSYRVVPEQAELTDVIGKRFVDRAGVEDVVYAKKEIAALLTYAHERQLVAAVLATVFGMVAGLLIFITIQMAIFARRREVGVMKLVGATNWFIRIPFMLEGMVQGVAGGLIASAIVYGLRDFVMKLVVTPEFGAAIKATPAEAFNTAIVLLFLGAAGGLLSSFISVRRFLDV
ncbi:MAG: cell division transport system permease protein [Actinomycetota bacterium]|jgi:cell division transport system permease protein|nr:cell division transport system permease protein [Actinomycetota bacterium]